MPRGVLLVRTPWALVLRHRGTRARLVALTSEGNFQRDCRILSTGIPFSL